MSTATIAPRDEVIHLDHIESREARRARLSSGGLMAGIGLVLLILAFRTLRPSVADLIRRTGPGIGIPP